MVTKKILNFVKFPNINFLKVAPVQRSEMHHFLCVSERVQSWLGGGRIEQPIKGVDFNEQEYNESFTKIPF